MDISISRQEFKEGLPEEEKEAFENIFPCNKYPEHEKIMISYEQWNRIKLDYEQKMKEYYGFIEIIDKPMDTYRDEPYIDYTDIVQNCPRILRPLQLQVDQDDSSKEQVVVGSLLQIAVRNKPDIQVVEIESLDDLEAKLIECYKCMNSAASTTEIDIDSLSKDLLCGKNFYKISEKIYSQICDFKYMNNLLLKPQKDVDSSLAVPYNKCLAIFMVFYYMRCNYLCTEFIKNMEMIMGNFHGLLDMRELMLKLHFPVAIDQEELIPRAKLRKLADGFPTLVDMKDSFYKFAVMESGHKITLCFSKSKSFYMNKITYTTFAEHFESMSVKKLLRYQQFRFSMIYTFKLIIPDLENFELAKSTGFIDSNRIDWQFWKENVIKCPLFSHHRNEDFLVKRQYDTLLKMKSRYYNFILNLYTDYQRKFVHEPVSLVFNIAAIIFALAGVIGVLQNARVIPPVGGF
jgi:hypothetical protein